MAIKDIIHPEQAVEDGALARASSALEDYKNLALYPDTIRMDIQETLQISSVFMSSHSLTAMFNAPSFKSVVPVNMPS
jgi:hypothetical protein